MKITATFAALALSLLPSLALANCPGEHSSQTAASCMPGTTWDDTKATCVATPSS